MISEQAEFRDYGVYAKRADGSHGIGFLPKFVCVSVCFPHDMPKANAARSPNFT